MNRLHFLELLIIAFLASACGGLNTQAISNLPDSDQTLLKEGNYKTLAVGQFYVHYPADSYTADNHDDFAKDLQIALDNVKRTIGIDTYDQTVHFILFKDQTDMTGYTQKPYWYYINPRAHIAYIVHNEHREPYFTRTLFQLAAVDNWGVPRADILAFGGALFAKGICQDITYFLDEVGAKLIRDNNYMSYRALFRDFIPALAEAPALAEIQAAALFQFVFDNFGVNKVKQLWQEGMSRLEGVVYMSPGEVESEIMGRWRNYTPTTEVDWEKIKLEGC
jgi:hypothetical protein